MGRRAGVISRDGAAGLGSFVWLWANAQRAEELELFEGAGVGTAEGSFVTNEQVEAGALADGVEGVGEAVLRSGDAMDGGEGFVGVGGEAVNFVAEESGFDGGDAAQAPAGGDHGFDQFGFDEAGGGEIG